MKGILSLDEDCDAYTQTVPSFASYLPQHFAYINQSDIQSRQVRNTFSISLITPLACLGFFSNFLDPGCSGVTRPHQGLKLINSVSYESLLRQLSFRSCQHSVLHSLGIFEAAGIRTICKASYSTPNFLRLSPSDVKISTGACRSLCFCWLQYVSWLISQRPSSLPLCATQNGLLQRRQVSIEPS